MKILVEEVCIKIHDFYLKDGVDPSIVDTVDILHDLLPYCTKFVWDHDGATQSFKVIEVLADEKANRDA